MRIDTLGSQLPIDAIVNRIHPFFNIKGGIHSHFFNLIGVLTIIIGQRCSAKFTGQNVGNGLKKLRIGNGMVCTIRIIK